MPDGNGNSAQTRVVAEQVAKAVIAQFVAEHPEIRHPKAEIPAPLKWAGAIVAALLLLASGGMATWLVTTVNEMQVTLARMDERMAGQVTSQDGRYADLERRVRTLETEGGSR